MKYELEDKRFLVAGNSRSGKDTFADLMVKHAGGFLRAKSSSMMALEIFLYDRLVEHYGLEYNSLDEAFEDRFNHREIWFNEITEYNRGDRTRLAMNIFEENNIYVGMRNREEFQICRPLVNLAIWVDSDRGFCHNGDQVARDDCDIVIPNFEGLAELDYRAWRLIQIIS